MACIGALTVCKKYEIEISANFEFLSDWQIFRSYQSLLRILIFNIRHDWTWRSTCPKSLTSYKITRKNELFIAVHAVTVGT